MAAKRKYKWEEWLHEPQTILIRGVDYHCSQSSMCQMIRNEAWERGVRVSLIDVGYSIVIEVVGEVPHPDKAAVAG